MKRIEGVKKKSQREFEGGGSGLYYELKIKINKNKKSFDKR
jgi:hypothetical protein